MKEVSKIPLAVESPHISYREVDKKMRMRTTCAYFFLLSSSTFTYVMTNRRSQAVAPCVYTLGKEESTAFLLTVEFEKFSCTEFQEGVLKGRASLFEASAMEKYIVQWKVACSAMENCAACNGKFHLVQWKVYNYNNHVTICYT